MSCIDFLTHIRFNFIDLCLINITSFLPFYSFSIPLRPSRRFCYYSLLLYFYSFFYCILLFYSFLLSSFFDFYSSSSPFFSSSIFSLPFFFSSYFRDQNSRHCEIIGSQSVPSVHSHSAAHVTETVRNPLAHSYDSSYSFLHRGDEKSVGVPNMLSTVSLLELLAVMKIAMIRHHFCHLH